MKPKLKELKFKKTIRYTVIVKIHAKEKEHMDDEEKLADYLFKEKKGGYHYTGDQYARIEPLLSYSEIKAKKEIIK